MRSRFIFLLFSLALLFGTRSWSAALSPSPAAAGGGGTVARDGGSDDSGGDDNGGDDNGGDDNGGHGGDDNGGDDNGGDDNGGDDNGGDDNGGDDNGDDDNGDDDNGDDDDNNDNGGGAGAFKFDQRGFFALEAAGVAIITIERSHGEDGAVSVEFSTGGGSATAGDDFDEVTTILTWANGDGSTKSVMVPITNDGENEPNETVELVLAQPTGGAIVDSERGTAVLTILGQGVPGDDDDNDDNGNGNGNGNGNRAGTFKFDERSFEVIESAGVVVVRVERSQGENGAATVEYSTADASAEDGSDYTAAAGTLSWASGDGSTKTFTVPILADDDSEGSETFNLALSNPTGGAVIDSQRGASLVQIIDDDGTIAACVPGPGTLCLAGNRFKVEATFRSDIAGSGTARAVDISDQSGLFWFFNPDNTEMLIKVLDACSLPSFHSFWVFFAATTNVDFTVRVTDTRTGLTRDYTNLLGRAALPIQDTLTFKTCQ